MPEPIKNKLIAVIGPTGGRSLVPAGEVHKYLAKEGYSLEGDENAGEGTVVEPAGEPETGEGEPETGEGDAEPETEVETETGEGDENEEEVTE